MHATHPPNTLTQSAYPTVSVQGSDVMAPTQQQQGQPPQQLQQPLQQTQQRQQQRPEADVAVLLQQLKALGYRVPSHAAQVSGVHSA